MIVQLSPGAGGQKGSQEVANSNPDGYTLLFSHNYFDMLTQHVENLPYDPMQDFIPVARVNYAPIAITVNADSPFQTFEDMVDAAAADPGSISLADSGNWGALFVPAVQMITSRDIQLNLVPYQGGGPAMQALLSGDADVTIGFPSVIGPMVESGQIRVLATSGLQRIYDDIPTFTEAGIEGDIDFMHRVVIAPAGTPDDVIAKLEAAFTALQDDTTYQRLIDRLGENVDLMLGDDYQASRAQQSEAYKNQVDAIAN